MKIFRKKILLWFGMIFLSILVVGCATHTRASDETSQSKSETNFRVEQRIGKYGVVNRETGDVVIPFQFEYIEPLSDTPSKVILNEKEFFINKNGESITSRKFDHVEKFSGPVTRVMNEISHDQRWGLINQKGENVLPIKFWLVKIFGEPNEIYVKGKIKGKTYVGYLKKDIPRRITHIKNENWEVQSVAKSDTHFYHYREISKYVVKNKKTGTLFEFDVGNFEIIEPKKHWIWNDVFVVEEDEAIFNVFDLETKQRKDRFQMGEADVSAAKRYIYRDVYPRCNLIRPRNISAGCPSLLFVYDLAMSASENELAEERKPFSKEKGDVRCCYLGVPIHPLYSYANRTFEQLRKNTRGDWTDRMGMGTERAYHDFVWEEKDRYVAFKMSDPIRKIQVLVDMRRGIKDLRYIQGDFIPDKLYEWEFIGAVEEQGDKTVVYNEDKSESVTLPMTFQKPVAYLDVEGGGEE